MSERFDIKVKVYYYYFIKIILIIPGYKIMSYVISIGPVKLSDQLQEPNWDINPVGLMPYGYMGLSVSLLSFKRLLVSF